MKKLELQKVRELTLENLRFFSLEETIELFDSMREFYGLKTDNECLDKLTSRFASYEVEDKEDLLSLMEDDFKMMAELKFDFSCMC